MRWLAVLALLPSLSLAEQPLPVYPGAVHTRIGNDLSIGGEYYRIAYFLTDDSPKKVAAYFEKLWREDGYPTAIDGDFVSEGIVSAFYTREGLMRSVVVRRHEKKTLAFSVLKDLWTRPPADEGPPPMPAPEGALFSQEAHARDDGGGTFSRTSLLPLGLEAAVAQVVPAIKANHYELQREAKVTIDGKSQRVVELVKAGEQVVLTFVQVEPGLTAVQQTWVGSDRSDAAPNAEQRKAAAPKAGKR